MKIYRYILIIITLLIGFQTEAATITVDSLGVQGVDKKCTLDFALISANTDRGYGSCAAGSGADVIEFALPGTIDLSSLPTWQRLRIESDIEMIGHEDGTILNQRGLVIDLNRGASRVRIADLGITGNTTYDAMYIAARLWASNSSPAEVVLDNLHIYNNSADYHGGAIKFYRDWDSPREVSLHINNSILENNSAQRRGGAIYMDECSFSPVTLYITNSILRNNSSDEDGGAIYNACGHLVVKDSTIVGNTAAGHGSAIYADGGFIPRRSTEYFTTQTEITNTTITGNKGESAVYILDEPHIAGQDNPELHLNNVTITNNESVRYTLGAQEADLHITNTVIDSDLTASTMCNINPLLTNTNNASSDASCGFTHENIDAQLQSLADNGGSTELGPQKNMGNILTMAIEKDSVLFNAGDNASCADTDARGINRPQDNRCDIGAYEIKVSKPSSSSKSKKKSSSVKYTCKDQKALNYDRFGQSKPSLCQYADGINPLPKVAKKQDLDNPHCPIFTQHMRSGDRDGKRGREKQEYGISPIVNEVLLLQKALTKLGFNPAFNQDGIFNSITKDAVSAFQMRYFNEILAPWGLKNPTGRFYQSTERQMNEVLGCPDSVTLDNGRYLPKEKTA